MKKITLFAVMLIISISATLAQKGKVSAALSLIEQKNFDLAKQKLDEAAVHEKTMNWPKTYYAYARFYQDLESSGDDAAKKQYENLLKEAYLNYQKAVDMDSLEKLNYQTIGLKCHELWSKLFGQGVDNFTNEKYEDAIESWEMAMKTKLLSITKDDIDTTTIFNIGIAALNAKIYDKAVDYFKQAAEIDYGGANVYILMKKAHMEAGDTTKGVDALKAGFEKFPQDQNVLIELINYYLTSGLSEEALQYLALAKEKDPDNPSFYHAEGTLLDKIGETDRAVESYNKAIELDPGFFDSHYNLGVIYFNKAVKKSEEVSLNPDLTDAEYEAAKKEVDDMFMETIPIFEKCHELQPDDINTMDNLKVLYYRLQLTDKHKAIVEKIDAAKAGQ